MTTTSTFPKSERFSRLVRDSALFAAGTALGKLVSLLMLPIVTRSLQPAAYGALEVVSTMMSAVASVLLLGMDTAVTRLYPEHDDRGRKSLFATWLTIAWGIGIPVAVTMILARRRVSEVLVGDDSLSVEVSLAAVFILISLTRVIVLTLLRNQGRPVPFAAFSGTTLALNAVVVVLLLQWEPSVRAVLLGNVLAFGSVALAQVVFAGRSLLGSVVPDVANRLFRLGLPLLPATVALFGGEVLLRAILFNAGSDVEVGYYGIAVRFGTIVTLVVVGLQTAWQPRAFAALEREGSLERIAIEGRRIVALIAVAAVAVAVVGPEAVRLVGGTSFADAHPAVAWTLLWALIYGVNQVLIMPSVISKHMGDVGLSSGVGMAIAVSFSLVLAAPFGAAGVAAALTIGQATALAQILVLGRHRAPIPFARARMFVLTMGAASAILLTLLDVGLGLRLGLGVLFVALLWVEGSLRGVLDYIRTDVLRFGRD